jgi:hypothetical protein
MICVACEKCGKQLEYQGALLFGPPKGSECNKWHICEACYRLLMVWMDKPLRPESA